MEEPSELFVARPSNSLRALSMHIVFKKPGDQRLFKVDRTQTMLIFGQTTDLAHPKYHT